MLYIIQCIYVYMIYITYNMEPAKLDDRELGCIDLFLFCCLLSSGLVWPTSWAILASSWAILASFWNILPPSGTIRAPSWLPKASRSLPRLNQTIPRGAQMLPRGPPEQKIIKAQKDNREGIDFWTNPRRNLKGRFPRGFCSNDPFSRVLHKMFKKS